MSQWFDQCISINFGDYTLIEETYAQSILFRILIVVDLMAILLCVICVIFEHVEHYRKRRAKIQKLKLMITPEYLHYIKLDLAKRGPMKTQDLTENQLTVKFPNRDSTSQDQNQTTGNRSDDKKLMPHSSESAVTFNTSAEKAKPFITSKEL